MGWRLAGAAIAAVMMAGPVLAQTGPVLTDPPRDAAHPARMEVVHILTHSVRINGVFYLAPGPGPHPTMVVFHGMPGNEQNLDLAQAIRRQGWNVLTLHYRGSWGSPGTYSYPHLIEDGVAALAFVRAPANASAYGVDVHRIVLAGHSSGGFVAVNTAVRSAPVQGLVLISGTDDAGEAQAARVSPAAWRKFVKEGFDGLETLVGCTPSGLANQLLPHGKDWTFAAAAPRLRGVPLLVITSDDGFAPEGAALAAALGRLDGPKPQIVHFATDHPYSDRRIALQQTVSDWLAATIH
ncbi:alpha/beta hydrolase [Phenylobacterium sp.]|jgi:acetyl esterase/lipase|uniref:alpha/beta hydrolase n=1 Tax=Phenylobacterium sp. TaxID=1871053 RepID=UPI002E36BE47|nr:alpha/beta hydrolase [Phenylobacterium sp.]HEX3367678.1 alpha/beta hydrolase [Phenylobacterium sp.]